MDAVKCSESRTERPVPLLNTQDILQLPADAVIAFHRDLPPTRLRRANWLAHPALVARRGQAVPLVAELPAAPALPKLDQSAEPLVDAPPTLLWPTSWAAIYNVVAIPVAAGVLYRSLGLILRPEFGALAMSASSITYPRFRMAWGPFPSGDQIPVGDDEVSVYVQDLDGGTDDGLARVCVGHDTS